MLTNFSVYVKMKKKFMLLNHEKQKFMSINHERKVKKLERVKLKNKDLFNDTSVKSLNDYYLDTGYFIECEGGQAATVGKDEKEGVKYGF